MPFKVSIEHPRWALWTTCNRVPPNKALLATELEDQYFDAIYFLRAPKASEDPKSLWRAESLWRDEGGKILWGTALQRPKRELQRAKKNHRGRWRVGGRGFIDTNLAPPSADHNVTMDFWNAQPDCKLWRVAMRAVLAVAVR